MDPPQLIVEAYGVVTPPPETEPEDKDDDS
jgi:hypothetical protein